MINKSHQHFPIWICVKCQDEVNQSYKFKQKCYKTYKLLKNYSLQLYAANKEKNIPNVPTEIFQEVKPRVDNNIISIDEEDHSENYYNADDITIVKNELLPSNFKNEPEFHNMIQEIIDNNFETIRQIDESDSSSITFKNEPINNSEVNPSNTNTERLVQEDEPQQLASLIAPETNNLIAPETNNLIASTTVERNDSINTINSLDAAAFTLNYTNASFETFASYVAPTLNVPSEPVSKLDVINTEDSTAGNQLNTFTRVLRRRKSICYRTMKKCVDEMDNIPNEKMKKRSTSLTNQTYMTKSAVKEISPRREPKKGNDSICVESVSSSSELRLRTTDKQLKKNNSKSRKSSVTRSSEIIEKAIKEHKQKCGAYFCEKCSKHYVMYSRFCLHTSKCNGIVRHQCTVCQKCFASTGNLRRHGKIHLLFKLKVNCDLCQNQYFTKTALRNHIRAKHNLNINKTNPFF